VTKRLVIYLFAGTGYRPLSISYLVMASPDRISKYMRGDANASNEPLLKETKVRSATRGDIFQPLNDIVQPPKLVTPLPLVLPSLGQLLSRSLQPRQISISEKWWPVGMVEGWMNMAAE